ncbi:MAG TPA: hypothetical protein VHB21_02010 [Minicystis sp.]|nr:hypothetical protein [Minicystis sp.]
MKVFRGAALLLATTVGLLCAVPACGFESGACEYPGKQCQDFMKRDCKSGTFTAGKKCSDLGYQCPNGGGICKK